MILKTIFYSPLSQRLLSTFARIIAGKRIGRLDIVGTSEQGSFKQWVGSLNSGAVIELGTRRTAGNPSTLRRDWVPAGVKYIATDFQAGPDVDVISDAERLTEVFEPRSVDAIIACSVFEHIRQPWLAAQQMGKVLRPGGKVFVQTHQTYPLHAHPFDYWRFSREALESLFSTEAGFINQTSWYEFPASILNAQDPQTLIQPGFLNVYIVAERAM